MESNHWKNVANLLLYLALISASLLQLKGVFQLYFSHLTTSSFFREPAEDGKVHTSCSVGSVANYFLVHIFAIDWICGGIFH